MDENTKAQSSNLPKVTKQYLANKLEAEPGFKSRQSGAQDYDLNHYNMLQTEKNV